MRDDFYDFDPFKLFRRFERMFSEIGLEDRKIRTSIREPLVDISENEKEIKIIVELPGVNKNDIDLEVRDNFLVIKAKMSKSSKREQKDYLYQERTYQRYYRMIPLPNAVDPNKIEAKYNNGILEITLQKKSNVKKAGKIKIK